MVDADLASLISVDRACDEVVRLLGSRPIDALALNAGIQTVTGDLASADGLELAFAVNFLAHFLIVERLKRLLRPGGRIVMTSSEVHDPEAFCLMGIGRATWQDPIVLADPVRSQDHVASVVDRGEARYCASKLLNLMHARHLALEAAQYRRDGLQSQCRTRNRDRPRPQLAAAARDEVPVAGARSRCAWGPPLSSFRADLLWLLTEADAQSLSGQYVDGRVPQPGSSELRDPVKIARTIEVAYALIGPPPGSLRCLRPRLLL